MTALSVVLWATVCVAVAKEVKFPPWFQFGTSTASYQVEGGWNSSDKSESIWDRFTHRDRTAVADLSNGDVSIDSYHLWRRDVEMAAELGLNFYRFSISWTRLLPSGFSNKISPEGHKYYSDLIDALLEKGVEPFVTIYHWDLPQSLQDLGGWTNPLIVDWFASYARVVFSLFADRVKTFITINEPIVVCDLDYYTGVAPGVEDPMIAPYLCNKHLLLAHAKAWRTYDEHFKPLYHGKVSISNHLLWYSPLTNTDYKLTKMVRDFVIGRYTHPIYSKEGGWPASVVQVMQEASAKEGYEVSRLPAFSDQEIQFIKGTYDFFAFNYYTCRLVRRAGPGDRMGLLFFDGIPELGAAMEKLPTTAPQGRSTFLTVCPKGLRSVLSWIKEQYGNLEMFITENGYSTSGSDLRDYQRVDFIRDHLEQILLSIYVDSVNVTAYTYWALMDNFEWSDGFRAKFGLYEVDLKSPNRTRTPRYSANFYSQVIRNRSIPLNSSEALNYLRK